MTRRWVAGLMVLAFPALATTLIAMDVAGLTKASEVIVRGTVVRVESRWNADRSRIITDNEIVVDQVLKGQVRGKTVVAMQPGGVVEDVGQKVHGVATFVLGEEVVVFLEPRGDRYFVVGLAQGRFVVDRSGPDALVKGGEEELFLVDAKTHQPVPSPDRSMTLTKLEALVRANVTAAPPIPGAPLTPRQVTSP